MPLGLFTRGMFSDDYACPALARDRRVAGAQSARREGAAVPRRLLPPQRLRRPLDRRRRRTRASWAASPNIPGDADPAQPVLRRHHRRARRAARGPRLCALPGDPLLRARRQQQLRRRGSARWRSGRVVPAPQGRVRPRPAGAGRPSITGRGLAAALLALALLAGCSSGSRRRRRRSARLPVVLPVERGAPARLPGARPRPSTCCGASCAPRIPRASSRCGARCRATPARRSGWWCAPSGSTGARTPIASCSPKPSAGARRATRWRASRSISTPPRLRLGTYAAFLRDLRRRMPADLQLSAHRPDGLERRRRAGRSRLARRRDR